MELQEAIKGRRSIRKFTNEPVDKEVLREILETAVWAPSAQNFQPWYLLALTDPQDLRDLFDILGTSAFSHRKKLEERFKNNPEVVEETMEFAREMGGATAIVLCFLRKDTFTGTDLLDCKESVAAAANDICLLAYEKGLATCWVNEVCREGEKLRERFAPDKGDLVCGIVMGHPAMEAREIKRKPGTIEIR